MFKKGDRVEWNYNGDHSTGTVIRMGSRSDMSSDQHVYVNWDDEGKAHADIKHVKLLTAKDVAKDAPGLAEESAVMFLLNRGYTISKRSC